MRFSVTRRRATLLCAILALTPACASAQRDAGYERRELSIPMRDGVRLFAVALIPKVARAPLPIILVRTPYSAAGLFGGTDLPLAYRELGRDGYIFVAEDIRGRFGSEGEFVMLRAPADPRSPKGISDRP